MEYGNVADNPKALDLNSFGPGALGVNVCCFPATDAHHLRGKQPSPRSSAEGSGNSHGSSLGFNFPKTLATDWKPKATQSCDAQAGTNKASHHDSVRVMAMAGAQKTEARPQALQPKKANRPGTLARKPFCPKTLRPRTPES